MSGIYCAKEILFRKWGCIIMEKMKNAVLMYESGDGVHKNIGDYIQSIAARQFTGHDAILIEREHLHEYFGVPVKLIMNAWWMHRPENWPPSENIHPLFTSFHVNPIKAEKMLSPIGVEYLKKHEPIGCRDKGTQRILTEKGINSYFSGCLTLTIGNIYKDLEKGDEIYFVDPYYPAKGKSFNKLIDICNGIFNIALNINNIRSIIRISKKMFGYIGPRKILRAADFFNTYKKCFDKQILTNATYLSHIVFENSFLSEEAKFAFAEDLLEKYGKAKLVVTSRLHAALPSLSMGTSVIFVDSDFYQDLSQDSLSPGRFEGLIELLNTMVCKNETLIPKDNFFNGKISSSNIPTNKNSHQDIAKKLTEKCWNFIENDKSF